MKNFTLLLFSFLAVTLQAQFTSAGTGIKYSLESISIASPATIIKESQNLYTIKKDINILATDSLVINNADTTVKLDPATKITVSGYFETNANNLVITSSDINLPYSGFHFKVASKALLKDTQFTYGGSILCETENLEVNNCEFYKNKAGIADIAIIKVNFPLFYTFSNQLKIHHSRFLENDLSALYAFNASVDFFNNYLYKNKKMQLVISEDFYPSNSIRSINIFNNTIIGDVNNVNASGIGIGSKNFNIDNNIIRNNANGITIGNSNGTVSNNIIEENLSSGISTYKSSQSSNSGNIILKYNVIRNNNGAGVSVEGFANGTTLGNESTENPGGNIFYNNKLNGEVVALYVGYKSSLGEFARNNCWREGELSTYAMVKEVIEINPGATLGSFLEEFVTPFLCAAPLANAEINKNISTIYPNPNNGEFHFINSEKNSEITIIDASGKKVFYTKVSNDDNLIKTNLKAGLYFLMSDKNNSTKKIIVK